jgi:signal transduction histidine kinase
MISALPLKNQGEILLTLQDITDIKNKDKLLYEQSKLASMGEMIGNIAHQWRQPLSIISSGATGMKLQKQFNRLEDKEFFDTCDLIDSNAQYLSKTINDFRDFIKGNREKKQFILNEEIDKFLNLVEPSVKSHHIQIIVEIEENFAIVGYPNELVQCFMNFFNNAKDAMKHKDEESRILKVTVKDEGKSVQLIFQDSGDGIETEIIDKIFEPYFTTKHQSIGTGLGLHMNYKMIVEGMNGSIEVMNQKFEYNNKTYKGAAFIVTLDK